MTLSRLLLFGAVLWFGMFSLIVGSVVALSRVPFLRKLAELPDPEQEDLEALERLWKLTP